MFTLIVMHSVLLILMSVLGGHGIASASTRVLFHIV